MKVTFDSNVWQQVVEPRAYLTDPDAASFAKIHQAIIAGQIIPFVSKTIFTLEGINRKDRKKFFGTYEAKVNSTEEISDDTFQVKVSIGADEEAHPGNHEHLAYYLEKAVGLGFKIIHFPRLGAVLNKDIQKFLVSFTWDEFWAYTTKAGEINEQIELLGGGVQSLLRVLSSYPRPHNSSMYKWLASVPASEDKHIERAIAEWADGDSITAHIAMGGNYFCTRDQAKGAGQTSILGAANVAVLAQQYSFKTVAPSELAQLL